MACCGGEHTLSTIETVLLALLAADGILTLILFIQNEISTRRMEKKMRAYKNRDDAYMKAATWIVCPMCDEDKCVGRFDCPEIAQWIGKKKSEEDTWE